MLEHTCLQGEAYEEDDSCAAIDHAELPQAREHGEGSHVAQTAVFQAANGSSGLEWQQAFDAMYGCFYYYRESTQVHGVLYM